MGRDLDRGFARGGQRELGYFIRYGVGFAGESDGARVRGLDGDSIQEPAVSGDGEAGVGNHFVSRDHAQDRRFVLAAYFLQRFKGGWDRLRRCMGWKGFRRDRASS